MGRLLTPEILCSRLFFYVRKRVQGTLETRFGDIGVKSHSNPLRIVRIRETRFGVQPFSLDRPTICEISVGNPTQISSEWSGLVKPVLEINPSD